MISETQRLLVATAFAAEKHRSQTRKDADKTPYINHPIKVALTLMEIGNERDPDLLVAAILHDTIEDTETHPDEILEKFGTRVLDIVLEVTDDKTLTKEERKRLQVSHASKKSLLARKLKLADKICNVDDIINRPPTNWTVERKLQYLKWAEDVLAGLRGVNSGMEAKLEELISNGRSIFNRPMALSL